MYSKTSYHQEHGRKMHAYSHIETHIQKAIDDFPIADIRITGSFVRSRAAAHNMREYNDTLRRKAEGVSM